MCFNKAKSSASEETNQSDERVTTGDNGVAIHSIDGDITIDNLTDEIASDAFNFLNNAQQGVETSQSELLDLMRDFAIGSVQATQNSLENAFEQSQSFISDIVKEKNPDAKSSIENVALAGLAVVAVWLVFGGKK